MKTYPLSVPENEIETEAEMHAEETRKAVARDSKSDHSKNHGGGRKVTPAASRDNGRRK